MREVTQIPHHQCFGFLVVLNRVNQTMLESVHDQIEYTIKYEKTMNSFRLPCYRVPNFVN